MNILDIKDNNSEKYFHINIKYNCTYYTLGAFFINHKHIDTYIIYDLLKLSNYHILDPIVLLSFRTKQKIIYIFKI